MGRGSLRAIVLAAGLLVLRRAPAGASAPVLTGHVQYETFGYPDTDTNGARWENFFAATLRGNGQFSSALSWQFEGRAVADDADFTAGAYSLRNATRRRPYLSLISGLIDYRPSPDLRVSVGKQLANWSIFDELQPAGFMNPRDESDPFRHVEQGVNAVSVHYGAGGSFAELVVVPLAFTPSRLPQGRWNIIQDIRSDSVEPQDLPPVRLNETQAGARVGTQLGALEASVVGYVGRDTEAIFLPGRLIFVGIMHGVPQFKAQIIDTYPRIRTGGVTASYPVGDRLLLRAEAVYYNSPDRDRDDVLQSVVGAEYALDDWRVVVNYLRDDQTVAAPFDISNGKVTNKGERRFFESFLFGEIRYDAGGRLRGQLRGGYDATGEFFLLEPEVSYRLWKTLRVALLGEVIDTDRSTYENNRISYFNAIRHEDRLGTRIEYDF